MNNFYLRYVKNNNAFRTISNIFKNYKKSCENFFKRERIKRNQSEPLVTQQRPLDGDICRCKPKSEVDLPTASNNIYRSTTNNWNNSKFDDNSSQESLNMTWYNSSFMRSPSNVTLSKKSSLGNLSIQDKLHQMPIPNFEADDDDCESNKSLGREYPWQNFNIKDDKKSKYEKVRDVENLSNEMIRKSILRKSEPKSLSTLKEVKFNKMASMMVYPQNNGCVMKQPRTNLCTNVGNGDKPTVGRKRKVKEMCPTDDHNIGDKLVYNKAPGCYRKTLKNNKERVKKCTTVENNLWCFNKKQKIC